MAKMTEEEIGRIMRAEIEDAIQYDRSDYLNDRVKAIQYERGEMNDLPAEEGRSQAVTHDVRDTIGWILPSLMRVFFASNNLGQYEPYRPEDEQIAKQATDYVNYVVMRECDGYEIFWDVLHDALLHANGIVKHWWDESQHSKTYTVTDLTEDQVAVILSDEAVEVLEQSVAPDPETQIPLYSMKLRRVTKQGRLRIVAVPPEEFLINRRARSIDSDTRRFVGQRFLTTRSELLQRGIKKELVDSLPAMETLAFDRVEITRLDRLGGALAQPPGDPSMEEVEVVDCYRKIDVNGDGIAEEYHALMGGDGSATVLEWEEWGGDVPFTDFVCDRSPHRWLGTSVYDDTHDIQKIKTVLLRQTLDNLYQSNIPDRVAVEGAVKNPDALFDRRIGNVIRVTDPAAIRSEAVPFTASASIEMMGYLDQVLERRTGVSRATMALDLEALQNQSATAVSATQSAAYSKIELIARNLSEMGFKRFFKCVLRLIVENQDRARTIRLDNKWVQVDPRVWNADMDVIINTGLGAGSRDKDALALAQIASKQEMIIAQSGPFNPIANISQYSNTLRKLTETTGIRNAQEFFSAIDEQEMQQLQQSHQQQPHQDPAMVKAMSQAQQAAAKIQIDRQKAAADAQAKREKDLMNAQADQQKYAAQLDILRQKSQWDLQAQAAKNEGELQLREQIAILDAQLKEKELLLEAELQAQGNAMRAAEGAGRPDVNIHGQQVPVNGD